MNKKGVLLTVALISLMLTMACNFIGLAFPRETEDLFDEGASSEIFDSSDADVETDLMTTAFPGSLDEPENPEPVVEFGDVPADGGLNLSPEELANQGSHHYKITGETNITLGGDGVINDEKNAAHQFTADGVNYTFDVLDPKFFAKTGPNTYEYSDEYVSETLVYTLFGYEYDSIGHLGAENHFTCTLDE